MKKLTRFISVLLTVAITASMFCIFAFAATGKSKKYDAFTTKTISVTTTKGSPYMTFESIGTNSYQGGGKPPIMSLKVYDQKSKTTKYYRITGPRSGWIMGASISSKLKLKANTKYTVTVSYLYDKKENYGTFGSGMYQKTSWYQGQWRIKNTKNLTYTIK